MPYRVHRTPAEQADQVVAQPLQAQAAADGLRVPRSHRNAALETEEVRQGQQVDVQGMALQPLSAVHQPPHPNHPGRGLHPEGLLQGLHGSHLVRHRADAADAGHDIQHLLMPAALQELLEVARRLEDAQPQGLDPAAGGA
jgi:hypothetical protein